VPAPIEDRQALADSLAAAGFWLGLPTPIQSDRKHAFVEGQRLEETVEELGWWADGEDLAEGDIETMLSSMVGALNDRGVALQVETIEGPHEPGSSGYVIRINGIDLELYRYHPERRLLPLSHDPWRDCTVLPLARVNELLNGAGSADRLLVFRPGANDGVVLLLPPNQIEIIESNRGWFDEIVVPD
jgi:hypothetical protein